MINFWANWTFLWYRVIVVRPSMSQTIWPIKESTESLSNSTSKDETDYRCSSWVCTIQARNKGILQSMVYPRNMLLITVGAWRIQAKQNWQNTTIKSRPFSRNCWKTGDKGTNYTLSEKGKRNKSYRGCSVRNMDLQNAGPLTKKKDHHQLMSTMIIKLVIDFTAGNLSWSSNRPKLWLASTDKSPTFSIGWPPRSHETLNCSNFPEKIRDQFGDMTFVMHKQLTLEDITSYVLTSHFQKHLIPSMSKAGGGSELTLGFGV